MHLLLHHVLLVGITLLPHGYSLECMLFARPFGIGLAILRTNQNVSADIERRCMNGESIGPTFVTCALDHAFCSATWMTEKDGSGEELTIAGCFGTSESACGDRDHCISKRAIVTPVGIVPHCCCDSDRCNVNYTSSSLATPQPVVALDPGLQQMDGAGKSGYGADNTFEIIMFVFVAIAVAAGVIIFTAFLYRRLVLPALEPDKLLLGDSTTMGSLFTEHTTLLDTENTEIEDKDFFFLPDGTKVRSTDLTLSNLMARGRYGTVWEAVLNPGGTGELERKFAVKVHPAEYHRYFQSETDIFKLPLMDHENLVKYYGSLAQTSERNEDQVRFGDDPAVAYQPPVQKFYWIVMEFEPVGTLQDFLKHNTFAFDQMLVFMTSLATGIAYLHADVKVDGLRKPRIAHRDLNSRNVLVKPNGQLCICDFGFAVSLDTCGTSPANPEPANLPEVGTVRYMSPEVLEGALNLREAGSALQQGDIYSMALILWEILTRCRLFYEWTGDTVPEFSLPYYEQVGAHPAIEQMQNYVCKKKARPLFPRVFQQNSWALNVLRGLIEHSWDLEADARLSAVCARERLLLLQNQLSNTLDCPQLSPAKLLGDSLTVNTTGPTTGELAAPVPRAAVSPFDQSGQASITSGLGSLSDRMKSLSYTGGDHHQPNQALLITNYLRPNNPSSKSTNQTTSQSSTLPYAATGRAVPPILLPSNLPSHELQPFQGLNPCKARNQLSDEHSDELATPLMSKSDFADKVDPCELMVDTRQNPGLLLLSVEAKERFPSPFTNINAAGQTGLERFDEVDAPNVVVPRNVTIGPDRRLPPVVIHYNNKD